jgi:adenosylhomocysteine nucleosidase
MSNPVLVCFALESEARPFRKLIRNRDDVRVLRTGMARRNTERAIESELNRYTPSRVFTCGVAGALDPSLRIGDLVYSASEPETAEKLRNAGAKVGVFTCTDKVAITCAEKAELRQRTNADAVEMESAFIQSACARRKIQCATVRAISDTANDDLPIDINRVWTKNDELSSMKLALAVVKAPHKIPALIRFGKDGAFAARQLARVLAQII